MRHLLQPRVLNQASLAAALTALACYPRLSLWAKQADSLVFLELAVLFCGVVLWGFVFAWHTPYSNRPVFTFKIEPKLFIAATALGLAAAVVFHFWLDPPLRSRFPGEYPPDLKNWFAFVPSLLTLNLLFLVFAPCDWFLRLVGNRRLAMSLAALFAASVAAMKIHSLAVPVPPLLAAALLVTRFASGLLAVWLYLRGGVLLVWWWAFLFELRHWLYFAGNP